MKTILCSALIAIMAGSAGAAEVTVKNDSLTDFSTGAIQAGFVVGEKGASWLTSPCDGNIVAAQIFWRSLNGGAAQVIGESIEINRAGTYPIPGALAQQINGPLLTDGVINEYRYLDDNNSVPLLVPVSANETFVISYVFSETPPGTGPSLVTDSSGIQAGKNAIYASLGGGTFIWVSSETFLVSGDWVIRAVVNCQAVVTNADVSATISANPTVYTPAGPLSYLVTISNAGPANASNVTIVDAFPSAYSAVTWSCAASGGATCTSGGSGNITQSVSIPSGGQTVYSVNGTVLAGTVGVLSNSVTAVVNAPATDPASANNTATANTAPESDRIFANGFDSVP